MVDCVLLHLHLFNDAGLKKMERKVPQKKKIIFFSSFQKYTFFFPLILIYIFPYLFVHSFFRIIWRLVHIRLFTIALLATKWGLCSAINLLPMCQNSLKRECIVLCTSCLQLLRWVLQRCFFTVGKWFKTNKNFLKNFSFKVPSCLVLVDNDFHVRIQCIFFLQGTISSRCRRGKEKFKIKGCRRTRT